MGNLDHDPLIQHFSHPHYLELINLQMQQIPITTPCSGCKFPPSGYMYSCNRCNFALHLSCTKFPQLITHASHPTHPLSLLPTSTYPGGLFNCDACNHRGNGFSYHCNHCDFDLHVVCASKPLSINHQTHPHPLALAFRNPYETKGFFCDICRKIGSKQWIYRCGGCEFDAHLDCATGTAPQSRPVVQPQQPLHHHHSFPGAINHNQFQGPTAERPNNYYMHSASMGGLQQQQSYPSAERPNNYYMHSASTGGLQQQQQQQQSYPISAERPNNYYMHSASMGGLQQQQSFPSSGANAPVGNGLMSTVVESFVEGAAQQVGQNLMQSIIGGGGGGGGGGDPSSAFSFDD